ncbi:MAG: hypothetical protein HQK72_00045 [Desulfamplus sp.]|nr:hypothetical protein [Desulfamplus sp.]
MDNFSLFFFLNCMLGIGISGLIFITPGIYIQYLLGINSKISNSSTLFFAPIFGMSIYGTISLLFSYIIGYSFLKLILIMLIFNVSIIILNKKYHYISNTHGNTNSIPFSYICVLLSASAFLSVLTIIYIYPFISNNALFINEMIFDHAKCAIIDSIVREGLQPLNPYFSPFGNSLTLTYYYQWYFLASQLKILGGLSGWQADIVMTWFTSFASISLMIGIILQITKARAAVFLILLFFQNHLYSILCWIFGQRFQNFFCMDALRDLEPIWLQLTWIPQHVFSGCSIILALFLCSIALSRATSNIFYSAAIGLSIAAAAGSSIWVGGIALALTSPLIIVTLLLSKIPKDNLLRLIKISIYALPWCFIFLLPVLLAMVGVNSEFSKYYSKTPFPVTIGLFASTNLIEKGTLLSNFIHVIMFWLQLLPLSLGLTFIIGLPALLLKIPQNVEEQYLKKLMISSAIGFLLVSQFFKSVILNNDLGWRAVILPDIILMIWASIIMSDFIYPENFKIESKWHFSSSLLRWRNSISMMTGMILTIGILSFIHTYHLPVPVYKIDEDTLKLRQRLFLQKDAWEIVGQYVKYDEIVQSNPDGYAKATPWPANLPFALFADRRASFSSPEFVYAYAHNFDDKLRKAHYQLIQNIFSKSPDINSIYKIRDELKIKALLIDQFDDVWNSTQIEDSGVYKKVYADENFKIYVAD